MNKILCALIAVFILNAPARAEKMHSLDVLEKEVEDCLDNFNREEETCAPVGYKCYLFLTDLNHRTQQCYKNAAVKILKEFYGASEEEAQKRLEKYQKFIYDEHFFLYTETKYCQKNNCGVLPYLVSEYAATQRLYDYIQKMIAAVAANE